MVVLFLELIARQEGLGALRRSPVSSWPSYITSQA